MDEAYADGLDAGWRQGRYEEVQGVIECPYPKGTPEHDRWWEGFSDGTEDYITLGLDF